MDEKCKNVVLLKDDIFFGKKPRDWKPILKTYVKDNLIGVKITVIDEYDNPIIVEFAKYNDRIQTKKGSQRRVIDKLIHKSDINSQLAVANSIEIIEVSFVDTKSPNKKENSHQWLDANGWSFRKAYIENLSNRKIYSVTLNIAHTKDGRNILYDINKISELGVDTVLTN